MAWLRGLKEAREAVNRWSAVPYVSVRSEATLLLSSNISNLLLGGKPEGNEVTELSCCSELVGCEKDLAVIVANHIPILAVPTWILDSMFSSKSWQRIGKAAKRFKSIVLRELQYAKIHIRGANSGNNTIGKFVRASEKEKHARSINGKRDIRTLSDLRSPLGLNDSEILGNIYIYAVAGGDSLSSLLAYTSVLLAAYPEWQSWVREEIGLISRQDETIEPIQRSAVMPWLKRCQALMVSDKTRFGYFIVAKETTK